MKWYREDIERRTFENIDFRRVVYTGKHLQLVFMSLKPREEIGMEVHPDNDQFLRFEWWNGMCIIDGKEYDVKDGIAIIVPAGARHNVINISETEDLKVYTIYWPPHHKDWTVHPTKEQAENDEEDFDGKTTE